MSVFDLPVRAIDAFEKSTGLAVTVHATTPTLWPFLPPMRASHMSTPCIAAKDKWGHPPCTQFDRTQVNAQLRDQPQGFIKICHARLVEWVVPVSLGHQQDIILFAGQRQDAGDLDTLSPMRSTATGLRGSLDLSKLPTVDASEATHYLELLAQLGARLQQWLAELAPLLRPIEQTHASPATLDRQQHIQTFIHAQHTQPITITDLADALNLSPSRAAHVVRETTRQSFGQLLTTARIRTAAGLLRHTALPMLDIATRAGFADLSNFHRRFKQHLGVTPLQYRKHAKSENLPASLSIEGKPVSPSTNPGLPPGASE